MKTVFKNSEELSHVWANKLQAEGRTPERSGGMFASGKHISTFFDGDLYFSYGRHYCLARHLPGGYVAINSVGSTVTTNRQKQEVLRATWHLKQIYVADPDCHPGREKTQLAIDRMIADAAKAKETGNRPSLLARAVRVAEHYNTFCDLVGAPTAKIEPPVTDPKHLEQVRAVLREQAKQEKARKKAREEYLAKAKAEQIADWRKGLIDHVPYGAATMLRVIGDEVQTSRGARIPAEDARRLWPIILRVVGGTKDYEVGMSLGGYRLTKIRRDGSIVVGCHDIPAAEIEGVARVLGFLKVEETT